MYKQIKTYTMKCRLYPNKHQRETIDTFILGIKKAFNITAWELKNHNPDITSVSNGTVWPDFNAMAKKEWIHHLKSVNPVVNLLPAAALNKNSGLFLSDFRRMHEAQGKLPVDAWFNKTDKKGRKVFKFYGKSKDRCGYYEQVKMKCFERTDDGRIFVKLTKLGKIRIRGWNDKIRYSEDGQTTFFDVAKDSNKDLGCRIETDNCGDYYLCITLSDVYRWYKDIEAKPMEIIGVDVGIKDLAILSDGTKYDKKQFKKDEQNRINTYKKKLAVRFGRSNSNFRDTLSEVRKWNRAHKAEIEAGEMERLAEPQPSKRYIRTDIADKRLARKIARRRENYQHEVSNSIVRKADIIAIESLRTKGLFKNSNLSEALADSAMSSLLTKIKYKAAFYGKSVHEIGTFDPSSQRCSSCGYVLTGEEKLILSNREWTCPICGEFHDRDINAAINIRDIAIMRIDNGFVSKTSVKSSKGKKKTVPSDKPLSKDYPDLVIRYSKDMANQFLNPFVIVSLSTKEIIDDAQGYGYKTAQNAQKCMLHKLKMRTDCA